MAVPSASHIIGLELTLGAHSHGVVPPTQGHLTLGRRAFVAHPLPACSTVVNRPLEVELLVADEAGLDLVIRNPVLGARRILQDTWGKGAGCMCHSKRFCISIRDPLPHKQVSSRCGRYEL